MLVRKSCHFSINDSNLLTNVEQKSLKRKTERNFCNMLYVYMKFLLTLSVLVIYLSINLNPAKVGNKNSLHIVTLEREKRIPLQ